jgi:hypothetical protein
MAMTAPTAHQHLQALERVAGLPGVAEHDMALLHAFARRIWQAYLTQNHRAWLWSFGMAGDNTYQDGAGWDARAVLRAFARLDPGIKQDGELGPGFYGFKAPILTSKAVHAASGFTTAGTWHHTQQRRLVGFHFVLPT